MAVDCPPCPKDVVLAVERSRENRARIMATEDAIQILKTDNAVIKTKVGGIEEEVKQSNQKLDTLLARPTTSTIEVEQGLPIKAKVGIGGGLVGAIILGFYLFAQAIGLI